jgi:hypothetical protein
MSDVKIVEMKKDFWAAMAAGRGILACGEMFV